MDDNKKEMSREEAEKDFKENVFNIFSEKYPDVTRDENGFIVIPRVSRKKKDDNQSDDSKE